MVLSYLIYHLAFFLCLTFAFISEKVTSVKYLAIFISLLFIIGLSGLRNNVGTDYESYVRIFDTISIDGFTTVEPGYYALNKFFKESNKGYLYVFCICSAITYLILYFTLLREKILTLGLLFTFTFGFVFLSNNIIRQALVIPVFFYSIEFIYKRKVLYFILSILLCSLFHFSALLLIPFYWVYKINFKKAIWFFLISFSFILSFTQIFNLVIIKMISFIPKYAGYLMTGDEDNKAIKSGATMILVYFFSLFIVSAGNYIKEKKYKIYYNLYLLGITISFLTMNISFLFRFSYYLTSLIIIVLPLIIKSIQLRYKKYIYSLFFIFISFLFWFKALWFNDHGCLPYNFFF